MLKNISGVYWLIKRKAFAIKMFVSVDNVRRIIPLDRALK